MIFFGIKNPNRFTDITLIFGNQMPASMFFKSGDKLLKIV